MSFLGFEHGGVSTEIWIIFLNKISFCYEIFWTLEMDEVETSIGILNLESYNSNTVNSKN